MKSFRSSTGLVFVLLIGALPLAGQWASLSISAKVLEASIRSREIDKINAISGFIGGAIDEHGEHARLVAKVVAGDDVVRRAMALGKTERVTNLAQRLDEVFGAVSLEQLEVTDADERVLYRAQDPLRFGDQAAGWGVSEALSGTGMVVSTKAKNSVAVRAIEPVRLDGKIVGTVVAGLLFDAHFFESLSRQVGSSMALLARNGSVLSDLHGVSASLDKGAMTEAFQKKMPIYRFNEASRHTSVYLPLIVVDDAYVVLVQLDSASAYQVIEDGKKRSGLFGILTILLSIGIGLLGLKVALRPLRQLRQLRQLRTRAEQMAKEVTGESISAQHKDEITAVVEVLDTLTSRLVLRNRDLVAVNAQVEAANHAKSQFLTTMSHEIRTPLNGVLGMAELLQGTPLNPEQVRYVRAIGSAGRSLHDLLGDILDLSKIEEDRLVLDAVDFDLGKFTEELASVYREVAATRGLLLTAEIAAKPGELVSGDMVRVRQILSNLLGNSIKFTSVGAVHLRLACIDSPAGDPRKWWRFTIEDTGIGIAAEAMGRIFKRFSQADASTTRNFGGSGLGLVISKRLVEIMGGQMHVVSELGQGSRFWFDLPFEAAHGAHELAPAAVDDMRFPTARILVAEDNDVNRIVVEALLSRLGAEVTVVENGEEARKRVAEGGFDLVLMDCLMPEKDGFEATRDIRAWEGAQPGRAPLPIVALTANALSGDREACLAAGMTDYMTKPVTGDRLVKLLWQYLPSIAQVAPAKPVAAPVAVSEGLSDFDPAVLQSLSMVADGSNPSFADEVIDLFLNSTKKTLAAIDAAFRDGQHSVFLRQVHTLRSSAARVGARELALEAERQENLIRSGVPEQADWHGILEAKFSRVAAAIALHREAGG